MGVLVTSSGNQVFLPFKRGGWSTHSEVPVSFPFRDASIPKPYFILFLYFALDPSPIGSVWPPVLPHGLKHSWSPYHNRLLNEHHA